MNDKEKRLQQIRIENYIWVIYLVIIGLSYIGNYFEKDFFLTNNVESKETYRSINTFIFLVLIIIYAYFEKDAYDSFLNTKNKSKNQRKYETLIFIASTAILISGFIFFYIIIEDTNLETEIAFN